jgi:hypothetical protein
MENSYIPFPSLSLFRELIQQKMGHNIYWDEKRFLRWYNQLSKSYSRQITQETLNNLVSAVAEDLDLPF